MSDKPIPSHLNFWVVVNPPKIAMIILIVINFPDIYILILGFHSTDSGHFSGWEWKPLFKMISLSLATSGNMNRLPSGNQTWQLEIRHYSWCSIKTSMYNWTIYRTPFFSKKNMVSGQVFPKKINPLIRWLVKISFNFHFLEWCSHLLYD